MNGPRSRRGSARGRGRSAQQIIEVSHHRYTVLAGRKGMPMIDHVVLGVHHLDESRYFYQHALAPLGLRIVVDRPELVGFGTEGGRAFFWLAVREPTHRVHVAFTAANRATVDAFHAAALRAGGVDNGKPGLRPQYHEHYYGAYAFDADGNNIEAVCHEPE
jgi:catechol 2,3-dioxygenase-like lactoylglutathione lyase family enzyme